MAQILMLFAVWVEETGLLASTYCLHFLNQTIAEVTPVTVPV
jgi:hypothetical protein